MQSDRARSLVAMSSFITGLVLALSLVLPLALVLVAAADTCTFQDGICPEWVSTDCKTSACFQARKVSSMQLGPAYDHTNKSADGWSAYAVPSPNGWMREARLSRMVNGPFCFTAWYHQSGTEHTQAVFSVDHLKSHTSRNFFDSQPDMYGRWRRVQYSENRTARFAIDIRYYTLKSTQKGVFAVDDLSLDNKACTEVRDGSCDFDWGETCGYDLGNERYGKWQLESRERISFRGPDYTTATQFGGLLYLELKGNETSAMLTSPKLTGRHKTQCLDFRYRLPPNSLDENSYLLHVFVQGTPDAHWTWPTNELSRGSWSTKQISFKQQNDFRVIIQCALRGRSYFKSYCAIDGIELRDCQGQRAQNDTFCDFEDGWCSWKSLRFTSTRFSWLLGGGNTKTTMARPRVDHTYGNATGSYVFFSNYAQKLGDEGDLISEILSYSSKVTQCAEFWYIISGDKSELKVITRNPTEMEHDRLPLWKQKSGESSEWQLGRIAVPHRNRVVFRATVGPASTPAFVALDDIAIVHRDRCDTFPKDSEALSATELISCDFYDWNFCKWSSMGASTSRWVFGINRSSSLGPRSYPADTTKGSIAYITGSRLAKLQGAAALQSPMVGPQSEPACFSFWYHMFGGRDIWLQLTLNKSPMAGGSKKTMVLFLQRHRTTADRWYNVRRTMVFVVANFKPLRNDAMVALGPFELTMGACDVVTDGRGYCDFEFDTCGWTAATTWRRTSNYASMVGPDASSVPDDSLYCLTARPPNVPRDGALLTSPEWPGQKQPQCLEFWYKYGGKTDPTLQVEVKAEGKSEVVWQLLPYPENDWMLARVEISQDKTFKFGSDPAQFVSLDNVILRPEPCVHPAECAFNDGLCGYVNKFQGNFQWLVGTGRYEVSMLQPAVPREKDTPPFAYLDLTTGTTDSVLPSLNTVKGDPNTAQLRSPLFDVTNDNTQLTIEYYRRGSDIIAADASVTCYGKAFDKAQPEVQSSTEMNEASQSSRQRQLSSQGKLRTLLLGAHSKMAQCVDGIPGTLSNQWFLNDPVKKLPDYPRFDHTLKAYRGRFIYTKHDADYVWGTAVFKSPQLDVNATSGACLSFWLFADHSSHVNLDVWSGIDRLYRSRVRSSHHWEHVVVNFKRPEGKFELWISFFMARALVALDDIEVSSGHCEQRDFCSWEIGSPCLALTVPGSFSDWNIRNGSEIGLPDHTTRNLTGRYLYLNTTAVDSHHPISRVFMRSRPPTEATCVTFWFSGRGFTGKLNVYRFTKETALRDPLVSVRTPAKEGQWIARRVPISSRNRWNLVFEGVATAGVPENSGIMIDDIEFSDGECPPYEYCTFEDECLPWVINGNEEGASFKVERAGHFDKLPQDHTTQTSDGYYLLFESPGTKGNKTTLTLREPLLYQCVSFWYFLPKLQKSVALYAQDDLISDGQGVWKRYQWDETVQMATVTVTPGDGFVAIDDVLIREDCSNNIRSTKRFDCGNQSITIERVCDFVKDCANGDDERNCGQCDFSDGLCGWKAEGPLNRGTTAWRRQRIGEVDGSPTTGAYDKPTGYYLLFSSNSTRLTRRRGRAIIDSPLIRNTNKYCALSFSFNYRMNGTAMDVDLYMVVDGYTFPVWTLSALSDTPEEGIWNLAEVEIGRYRSEISFYFRAFHDTPGQPLFAVDDIQYTACALPTKQDSCDDMEFRCANGACVMQYDRCDYVDDCGDNSDEKRLRFFLLKTFSLYETLILSYPPSQGDHRLGCNFDNSFCDWVPQAPTEKSKLTWRLERPGPFLLQSPTRDHTTGTPDGAFMIIKSTKTTKATVIGPTLDNSTLCTMTFFHATLGRSKPKLTLAYRTTKNGTWKALWTQRKPNDFFDFLEVFVELPKIAPYQVAFIGEHRNPDKYGYIAIDDVQFWESCTTKLGGLPSAPVPAKPSFTCTEQEFQCTGIRQCIPLSKVCDFMEDCSNGADESRCGACEFTTDLCGLENEDSSARFGWNWTTVEGGKKKQGFPSTDSRMNMQGAYAAYSIVNPEAPSSNVLKGLTTPPLGPIAHSCVVYFYAYIPNMPAAMFLFGVKPDPGFDSQRSNVKVLGTLSGRVLKGQWRRVFVRVGNWDAGARFVYLANSVGVSIDRPEYKMCHPDTQSEGAEAAEKVSCTFSDPSNCGWFPERKASDTIWTLNAGGTEIPKFKWQPFDSDSHKGPYMYAQNLRFAISKAHLVSVKMSPTPDTGRCFTFWYNMWHPNVGRLNLVKRVENESNSLLWTRLSPQGKEWKQGQVQVYSDDPHQLIFEAVLFSGKRGMIAIDNFVLNDTSCSIDKFGGCNFESDSCGWQLHNWQRTSASMSIKPTADHTTQSSTGRFVLAKSPGGRMVSPESWYDATQPKCFRFWYFLTGTPAEVLRVTRVLKGGQEVALWRDTPYQDNSKLWRQASVNLPAYNETPTIVFDATTSDAAGAVIAVDDFSLGSAPCPSPGSCSFEEDMCGWTSNIILNNALWYRHRGATVYNTTGYYLLLDAADLIGASFGSLQSPKLPLGPSVCFSLHYSFKNGSGAALTVAFFDQKGGHCGSA
ncbi:hypothetical protein MRX96_056678 [Rhipicephalus microplus]